MRRFAVSYSFTCPSCLQWSAQRIEVVAADQVDARDRVLDGIACSECGAKVPTGQFVRTEVVEI